MIAGGETVAFACMHGSKMVRKTGSDVPPECAGRFQTGRINSEGAAAQSWARVVEFWMSLVQHTPQADRDRKDKGWIRGQQNAPAATLAAAEQDGRSENVQWFGVYSDDS